MKKNDNIDKMWETLLLAIIGEQFGGNPNVIGISLSLKVKERLIQVWIADSKDEKLRTFVSNKVR